MSADRTKAYFNGVGHDEFRVARNHEHYEDRKTGLYLGVSRNGTIEGWGAFNVDDIPGMIEALQGVYDEFEANKPNYLHEVLADLPNGTVIKFDSDYTAEYVKIDGKWLDPTWVNMPNNAGYEFKDWPAEAWKFKVKYNPKEAN